VNTLRLTPQADIDLTEHTTYLAQRDQKSAERFLNSIQSDLQNLCLHPELGNERYRDLLPEAGPIRYFPVSNGFSNWLIFYVYASSSILVIRIIHGSRDIPDLLTGHTE